LTKYELREEIDFNGRKYFLQTSHMQEEGRLLTSFFKNGALFDRVEVDLTGEHSEDEIKAATKNFHAENKRRFLLLLKAQEKIKSSIDHMAHLRVAQALFGRNLFVEAIQEAKEAIKNGCENSEPYIIIGESYYRLGEYEKARKSVKMGIEVNPEYPDIHNLMGKIQLKMENCRGAIESFQRAINLNIYYGEPYLNLAKAYVLNTILKQDYELSRGLDEKVKQNLEKALQLDPHIDRRKIDEAINLFNSKEYNDFVNVLDEARLSTRLDMIDEIFLDLYLMTIHGGEEFREEDIEKYLKKVLEVVDRNPTYADGYNSLGILYTAKCKIFMDKASEAFKKALEINRNYRKAQKNLRLAENDRNGIFILLKALLD